MSLDLIQRSFSGGEWSPLLDGRSDLEKYFSACRTLLNMICTRYGPAERRPGLYYVAEVKDSDKKSKLFPFKYSTVQAYMLEYGDEIIRFFMDRGQILHGVGTEDISALDNQIAHWLLNEVAGVAVDDAVSVVPHDGTASADASVLHADGKVGAGCFDLDGQYDVEVANNAAFNFTDDSNDTAFSIVGWGYVTQQPDIQTLISKWRRDNATREWRFSLNNERKLQLHLADTQVDLSGDRVAQWYLNDDAADTHVDDVSTNHDGVSEDKNTTDFTATGKINACLNFGGDQSVEVADNAALSFVEGTNGDFSIAGQVYVTTTGAVQFILSKSDFEAGSFALEWELYLQADKTLVLRLWDNSKLINVKAVTDVALTEGWHFVGATYEGEHGSWTGPTAADYINLYVDDSLVDSTKTNNAGYVKMESLGSKVCIGASHRSTAGNQNFWADKMDNIILFSATLTAANMLALYNDGDGTESMGAAIISAVADDAISLGWHLFGVSYSAPAAQAAAADGIILYVDGAAVDSTKTNDATYTAMQGAAEEVRIGSQRNSGDTANEKFWGDKLDEMSVFSDVLTPAEMASLYSTAPYEIASPYPEADLFGIQRIQSADVMYGFHSGYNPRKLSRFEHNLWELESIDFDWPPFMDENKTDTTITPSATVGTIELTATDPIFTSDHVGSYFLIKHPRSDNKVEKLLTDDYDAFLAAGITDILVDVEGSFRVRTSGTWTGTVEIQQSYDGQLVLVLDSAPAGGAWAADDIITGATSGDTCVIVSATDTTHYVIKQLSGSFTDGEILSNQAGNSRDVAATYPRYEGWFTLEPLQSTNDLNFNNPGEETLGDAYFRAKRTIDSAGNDPTVTISCERYYHYGIVKITGFTSATSVTGTVIRRIGSTDATKLWSEGAWSDERGYPSCGTFHEERLMVGGTTYRPHDIKGSMTDDWENFRGGTLDDRAIANTVAANEMNAIQWMLSKDILFIGTAGGEWKLGSFDSDEPLTPGNPVKPKQQTAYGSKNIQAILLSNVMLFVVGGQSEDAPGRVVRGAQYIFDRGESGGYDAPDYTTLSNHITKSGIVSMAYQQQPEPVLWCVLDNGTLIGMTFEPGEKIWGWFRVVTDGLFEDVAVIPGVSEDEVWVIVNRTIDGMTKRYIEYFKPRDWGDDQKDCFFVDSGLTFDGGAAVTITGITQADPAVVTAVAHGLSDGDQVRIRYVGGMTEVNNKVFSVSSPATDTFELRDNLDTVDIDSSAFTAFAASITGDTTYDSADIKNVSAADIAKLALGAPITAVGVPSGATVVSKNVDWFTMSTEATFTDTAVTIDIGGTVEQVDNTFSGLDHLEGKTVSVLGDGSVHPDVVVTAGEITLTDYYNKVHAGLPYDSDLMPMKLEFQTQAGTVKAKTKKIDSILFSFYNSLGCTFGTTEGTETIPFRKTTDAMGKAVPLFTGEKEQTFPGGYELNGDIFVRQSQPLPLTVRSITPHLELYG